MDETDGASGWLTYGAAERFGSTAEAVRRRNDSARAFETAIEALREQLGSERRRVDELLVSLAEERRQIDRLHVDLADAVTAERIAAGEAAALRAVVDGLRTRPWWRRWFR
jgi:hypothetical protein